MLIYATVHEKITIGSSLYTNRTKYLLFYLFDAPNIKKGC